MLPVIWLSDAIESAENIVDYVSQRNRKAAQKIRNALVTSTEYAANHPYMYRRSQRILGQEKSAFTLTLIACSIVSPKNIWKWLQ